MSEHLLSGYDGSMKMDSRDDRESEIVYKVEVSPESFHRRVPAFSEITVKKIERSPLAETPHAWLIYVNGNQVSMQVTEDKAKETAAMLAGLGGGDYPTEF